MVQAKRAKKFPDNLAKPGALVGVVDSLQKDDDADFEWALKQFPLDFHEPFFKSYVENPLQNLFAEVGLVGIEKKIGFLSKSVLAQLGSS